MSASRYERVSANEDDTTDTHTQTSTPNSPPPSFRSRTSSPSSSHEVNQTLADSFDSDDENDTDDRQRLMRAAPADTPAEADSAGTTAAASARRNTHLPVFSAPTTGRVYGGGSGSDGVFANLSAKPESGEKLEEHPPTYEQAAADAAPPYWETTILAPGFGGSDDVYIEGLPVGSVFSFVWNAMISMSFQLVGFLLTYLLHTTHAAKNGSRAGLGITLVQYGFYMKGAIPSRSAPSDSSGDPPPDPNAHDFDQSQVAAAASEAAGGMPGSEWLAYGLMILGWFILIRAISDFVRARRHEQLVLQSPDRGLTVPVIATGEEAETVV